MRVFFTLLILISVALQSAITWYWWETPTVLEFEKFFRSFYGEVPAWSSFAFSLGSYWIVLPIATLIITVVVLVLGSRRQHLGKLATISLALTTLMVYAMYPLHLMLGQGM
ncbi:hypothetical protein [Marinobacter sp.]|uniref:hypothetical protein n=1 Tax=Marinobacter sp. TaxID=50741 RepID=UPI003A92D46E